MRSFGRILLFHCRAEICKRLASNLKENEYDVAIANSYEEALKLLEENEISLFLVDIDISENQGLDIISDIKAIKSKLPIVLITSNKNTEEDCEQAKYYGAAACLSQNAATQDIVGLITETFHCGAVKDGTRIDNYSGIFEKGNKIDLEVIGCKTLGNYSSTINNVYDDYFELLTPTTQTNNPIQLAEDCSVRIGIALNEDYYCFAGNISKKDDGKKSVLLINKPDYIFKVQRRAHSRKNIAHPAKYSLINDDSEEPTQEISAKIINISLGGARLISDEALIKGDLITLAISTSSMQGITSNEDEIYTAVGYVLRCNATKEGFETAFKFTRIDDGFIDYL
jgi:CheY-like chemotaxis protein